MSRSYKKTCVFKYGSDTKFGKRHANKVVRRYKGTIPKGSKYKHLFCSYEIHDYYFRRTRDRFISEVEESYKMDIGTGLKQDKTLEETLKEAALYWKKFYRAK